jgi:quinol monooxygenase YgiN
MHVLIVRFDVLPDRQADFDRLVSQTLAEISVHEPGTRVYVAGTPVDSDDARVFVEVYRDSVAFAEHEAQPHTQRFLALRGPMLRSFTVDVLATAEGVVR